MVRVRMDDLRGGREVSMLIYHLSFFVCTVFRVMIKISCITLFF